MHSHQPGPSYADPPPDLAPRYRRAPRPDFLGGVTSPTTPRRRPAMPELAYKRNVGAPGLSLIVIKALSAELANNRVAVPPKLKLDTPLLLSGLNA